MYNGEHHTLGVIIESRDERVNTKQDSKLPLPPPSTGSVSNTRGSFKISLFTLHKCLLSKSIYTCPLQLLENMIDWLQL